MEFTWQNTFENTKVIIRIHKSKDSQYNGLKKKDVRLVTVERHEHNMITKY